jgi:hypothetical protein
MDFLIMPKSGKILIDAFLSVAEVAFSNQGSGPFSIKTSIANPHYSTNGPTAQSLRNEDSFKAFLKLIEEKSFIEILRMEFTVRQNNGNETLIYEKHEKDFFAHIKLNCPGMNNDEKVRSVESVNKHFQIQTAQEIRHSTLDDVEKSRLGYYELAIGQLTNTAAALSQNLAESEKKVNQFILEQSQKLEAQFQVRREALEKEYEQRKLSFDDEKKAFETEKSSFDLRQNTALRRKLHADIKELLNTQSKAELSESTSMKRWWIHVPCILSFMLSICLIYGFSSKLLSQDVVSLRILAPLGASIVLFASTLIFYIKWNNRWFEDHARAEFNNKKLQADTLRASWLVEMFFEWKDKKEVGIPDHLLNQLSEGLFKPADKEPENLHPLDQLFAMMRRARIAVHSDKVELDTKK